MEDNTIKISHILFMVLMMGVIIVVSTYAWLSYRSNDTAMVLTIGEINNIQVTLSPYQIKASLLPQVTYTSDNYTLVNAVNNSNTARNIRLYYKITNIDSELISSDFKYTIERSTDGTTYSKYGNDGNFSSASNGAEITILEENIPSNTTYKYKVYLWIDGSNSGQSYMQGKSFSGELRADVEQPTYTVTFKDNLFNIDNSNNFNGLTIDYDTDTSILTIDGSASAGNITLSIVNGLLFNVGDVYDFDLEYLSGSVTGDNIAALIADVVTNLNGSTPTPRNNSRRNLIPTFSDGFSQTINENAAENGIGFKFWIWLAGSNSYTFNNYKLKAEFYKRETMQVKYGDSYGDLPIPTRTGYTFLGWHGKNMAIFSPAILSNDRIQNGITWHATSNNTVHINGTATGSSFLTTGLPAGHSDLRKVLAGTYTLSSNLERIANNNVYMYGFYNGDTSATTYAQNVYNNSSKTFTLTENSYTNIQMLISTGTTINQDVWVQLEEGTNATEYEPYYITSNTTVVQNKNHTLTAIWQEN